MAATKIKLQVLLVVIILFFLSCGSHQVQLPEKSDSITKESVVISDSLKKQVSSGFETSRTVDSAEEKGLRMIAEILSDSIIQFTYKNTGSKPYRLWTKTEGYGLTWNAIDFEDESGKIISLKFDEGMREKSGIAKAVELQPGKTILFKENLYRLIRFRTSEKRMPELKKQKYLLTAFYNSSWGPLDRVKGIDLQSEHWNGQLNVSALTFVMR